MSGWGDWGCECRGGEIGDVSVRVGMGCNGRASFSVYMDMDTCMCDGVSYCVFCLCHLPLMLFDLLEICKLEQNSLISTQNTCTRGRYGVRGKYNIYMYIYIQVHVYIYMYVNLIFH